MVLTPTRILHDTVSPRVETFNLLDSGKEVPADGHVMMVGKDLPFRLELSDPEGLNSLLEVWTWMEKQDDDNGDGVMDEGEYTCLLYTSPSPRDATLSRMPSSA